ncbi:MAG: hypothetical protein CEO12_202 [Parcubacteria group bacterium Gr01-1014_46]|nr:MAG: hypothetical protein CEO12_202 [Parcubacteria group bacterium Gr01-1014_46]
MLVDWLANKWAVNDPLPHRCDLLVPVAHGATSDRLTCGAESVARKTVEIRSQLRGIGQLPYLVFGAFTGSEKPELEKVEKHKIFRTGKYVGTVISTIEECLKVKRNLPDGFTPRNIVVVTDEAHSRRCRIVWRTFFPQSNVKMISVKLSDAIDAKSPMTAYGNPWKALFFQAGPTPVYWLFSRGGAKCLSRLSHLHTPTK